MKILFYDGEFCNDVIETEYYKAAKEFANNVHIIDGSRGPKNNMYYLNYLLDIDNGYHVALTNSLIALSHLYGWNERLSLTDIYIWKKERKSFVNAQNLVDKKILKKHDMMRLYLSGCFDTSGDIIREGEC